jgi:hypothetical protein
MESSSLFDGTRVMKVEPGTTVTLKDGRNMSVKEVWHEPRTVEMISGFDEEGRKLLVKSDDVANVLTGGKTDAETK